MASITEGKYNRYFVLLVVGLLACVGLLYLDNRRTPSSGSTIEYCVQPPAIVPSNDQFANSSYFFSKEYTKKSVEVFAGALRFPTMSYDDMSYNVTSDPRFEVFGKLHKYLLTQFPLVAKYVEKVNTYGLLFTIPGTDPTLKPVMLMAHQDVVPVNAETLDQWTHPPFEGHFDGERLWGRGAADTKNSLVAQLEAVEHLLLQGWVPTRDVILSFGFDEESGGRRGALHISKLLQERYGENGVEMIVDEGTPIVPYYGTLFAAPGVAEKGRAYYTITLDTPGGHSSMPPPHTAIGIMADLIVSLEDDPLTPDIKPGSVIEEMCNCIGEKSADISKSLRKKFINAGHHKKLVPILDSNPYTRVFVRTSQANDVVHGGLKLNALPEEVELQVDYRIAIHQTVQDITQHVIRHVKEIADKHGLGLFFDDRKIVRPSQKGNFLVNVSGIIDPAPVTPTKGYAWDMIVGTTRHVIDDVADLPYDPVVVMPAMMPANTDTAHFWAVSKNIFRYLPLLLTDAGNFHTVDEWIGIRNHFICVAWYYEFLLNTTL